MSFWDHIKPSQPAPTPTALERAADRRALTITWSDGPVTTLTARILRGMCPCAACVDEWTQERRHDVTKVPETTTIEGLQTVGNYAVSFTFSDGHGTGIYNWETLRRLSDLPAPAA